MADPYIIDLVDAAPPLTEDQRERLARLLAAGAPPAEPPAGR